MRLPIDAGRGISNVVARSTDGLTFETVAEVTKDQFGGVGAPAGELGCRGRDDHGARDQHRRRAVDMAGHGADRPAGGVGRPARTTCAQS
ncbi:MAG TPA: hypothetical protein VFG35_15415 [Actinoplanes sp.]|nr:hypothetical protein [Actinoplanes sp.]